MCVLIHANADMWDWKKTDRKILHRDRIRDMLEHTNRQKLLILQNQENIIYSQYFYNVAKLLPTVQH